MNTYTDHLGSVWTLPAGVTIRSTRLANGEIGIEPVGHSLNAPGRERAVLERIGAVRIPRPAGKLFVMRADGSLEEVR